MDMPMSRMPVDGATHAIAVVIVIRTCTVASPLEVPWEWGSGGINMVEIDGAHW